MPGLVAIWQNAFWGAYTARYAADALTSGLTSDSKPVLQISDCKNINLQDCSQPLLARSHSCKGPTLSQIKSDLKSGLV